MLKGLWIWPARIPAQRVSGELRRYVSCSRTPGTAPGDRRLHLV